MNTKKTIDIRKKVLRNLVIIGAFLLAFFGNRILQGLYPFSFQSPFWKLVYVYSFWLIPIIISLWILYGSNNILSEIGIRSGWIQGLTFGLIATSPMLISSAIMGEISHDFSWLILLKKTFIAGFMEEVLFRGFLFGILFLRLGWGFIPASMLGALIFAISHLYQGENLFEFISIFSITFIGSAWFAWLYIEWNQNLWIPIFLHAFMNLSWILFDISSNAIGDVYSNIFRIATITITVIATIIYNLKRNKFNVNSTNLLTN